ncbi:PrgI family protein [Paenibacillus sp. BGI2013]|uniref:PrgI family protein n=1 Tax=Paenibacillus sp. BGI2013 TaxID=2058902 RepID=UPI00214B7EA2|nr:PrgI family protein [Paenibacillus sp. BGI2013]
MAFYFRQFGIETLSWMCLLGAEPCAALGFIGYHGMTTDQLLRAYLKFEFPCHGTKFFYSTNTFYKAL